MPKSENQKYKALYVAKYLLEYSDADHYVGLTEKRVQTAEMQKSAATIDVADGLHSWPEY